MIPEEITLNATRGDDTTFQMTVKDADGAAVDLTGASIYFTVKHNKNDIDDNALIQKKNSVAGGGNTEIEITNAVGGVFQVKLLPADTVNLHPVKLLYWDVQLTIGGRVTTPAIGEFHIIADITRG